MIKQESIERVLDHSDIQDVISEFIGLKKRGVNYIGLCPFHNEKTPSFTVSPSKNIYKCFGCGASGNSVKFIMEHEHLSYPEAIRFLANKYQIEIEETSNSYDNVEDKKRESLYILNKFANEHFKNNLLNTEEGTAVGLQYFKQRGFDEKVINKFELGYAIEDKKHFTKTALKNKFDLSILQDLRLTTRYESDFFSGRVIFPIHNLSGKVIAFGGRTLKTDPKVPKYLNSSESDIYNKSRSLYGLYQAKKAIRANDECLLVEGYTDVLSLAQTGIENVVASSGTSLTDGQINLIKRHTDNICIIYDGDTAGIKASFRGIDLILQQDMNVKVLPLPEGEDPDSFIKKLGKAEFESYLEKEKKNFIFFKTALLIDEAKKDPIKLSSLIKDIIKSISIIPDSIKRAVFIKQCSRKLKMDEQTLFNELNKQLHKNLNSRSRSDLPAPATKSVNTQERPGLNTDSRSYQEKDIIRVILEYGDKMIDEDLSVSQYIFNQLEDATFDENLHVAFLDAFRQKMQTNDNIDQKYFINHENKELSKFCINLIISNNELSENWYKKHGIVIPSKEDNYINDVYQAVAHYQLKRVESLIQRNLKEISLEKDESNIIILQKQNMMLNVKKNEIASFLSTILTVH